MAATRSGSASQAAGPRVLHLAQCRLVVIQGAERGREYVGSADVIRIGKAQDNDLVLSDETVSRVHLELLRDAKGYLVRDLHSTNGTFIDGAEIREAYVRPGSIITVGKVQLRFQPFEEQLVLHPADGEALGELYGRSPTMRCIFTLLERVAPLDLSVLIEGEPGTGKELVARTLHGRSRRRMGPWVAVDCRALTGHVLESALFGHEKGAFPGATARAGALEQAHGGTLFLDHIDDLSVELQPRLLQVLEQRSVRRLGGKASLRVDLRCIAASERELAREVERGKFQEDLYFRLSTVIVALPPLCQRREDIPGLVERFVRRRAAGDAAVLDEATRLGLAAHAWPGNVRELAQVLEGGLVGLWRGPASAQTTTEPATFDAELSYRATREHVERDFERRYLTWLLAEHAGNISGAARAADMDRKYLYKLLKRHALVDSARPRRRG